MPTTIRAKVFIVTLAALFCMACILFSGPARPGAGATPSAGAQPTATGETAVAQPTNTSPPAASSLNATGPHVVFAGQNTGVWITNPDGSFPTHVTDQGLTADLRKAISPAGDRMALVAQNDQGLDLLMVKIPGGETETIVHLLSIRQDEAATTPKAFASYAVRDIDSLAWQPGDGRYLAFMGVSSGPTSDLFMYDTRNGEVTQLTNGPAQAIQPVWSPDGRYILHFGVSWVPPFGGAIVGPNRLDGVWSVRVSDGKVITLPKPKGVNPHFVGWQDNSHFLTYDSDETCFSKNLRSVDLANGKTTAIMPYSFDYYIARSPENAALLFSSVAGCADSLGDGTYLLPAGEKTPIRLLDKSVYGIEWMPESGLFNAYPEALFSADGKTRYDPPVYDASYHPAVSKNGYQAWEVIQNQKGRVVIKVPGGGDWKTILEGSVAQLIWDPVEGRTLLIALRDGSLYAASYPDFKPVSRGRLGGLVDQAIWLP